MREMTIRVLCDRCGAHLEGVSADHKGLSLVFGDNDFDVDLCESCRDAVYHFLQPIMAKGMRRNGQNGPGKRGNAHKSYSPRQVVECPECGKSVSVGSGLTIHTRRIHPDRAGAIVDEAMRTLEGAA